MLFGTLPIGTTWIKVGTKIIGHELRSHACQAAMYGADAQWVTQDQTDHNASYSNVEGVSSCIIALPGF